MIRLKPLLIVFMISLSGFNRHDSRPVLTKWVISKGCSLHVGGSTNVNTFTCVIADYYKPDTLVFYKAIPPEPIKITGILKLNVQKFDCHNPVMTSDLRKTLKSKIHPDLSIQFINLSRYPDKHQETTLRGAVNIELAGVTKRFEVDYRFIPNGAHAATLIGTRKINFSDFDLVPPRKLGGMIKTNDELRVVFSLNVKVLR